jgi:hypothetical protein
METTKKSLKEFYPMDEVTRPIVLENLALLSKKQWVHDYGFNKAIENGDTHLRGYFAREKSNKALWDVLSYMDRERALQGIKYYNMPFDTIEFIIWCYDVVDGKFYRSGKVPTMEKKNYIALYKIWKHNMYPEDRKSGEIMYKL